MTVTFTTKFGGGYLAEPTFEAMRFPGGEAHLKVINEREGVGEFTQYARVDSADGNDLMTLLVWGSACLSRGERSILHIPYLPGARADHEEELVFGAQVYSDIINHVFADSVVCFDPHSPIMPSMIRNIQVIDSTRLVREHIVGHADKGGPQKYQGIIAPDKGAVARAQAVADACHIPLYKAEKVRNSDTGKLSEFTCEPLPDEGKFLVVDDICDGGGTFMGLAETTGIPRERLGLYVSHGVFSGQFWNLLGYYDEIWTTDSLDVKSKVQYENRIKVIPLDKTLNGFN